MQLCFRNLGLLGNIKKNSIKDVYQFIRFYTTLNINNKGSNSNSSDNHIITKKDYNSSNKHSFISNGNKANIKKHSYYNNNYNRIFTKDSKIHLSEKEEEIINLVCKIPKLINRDDIIIRIAGGWVRDKLLNINKSKTIYDIDFALENISGEEFVKVLSQYIGGRAFLTKINPSKSKHLETACLELDGFSLEFNALRTDEYTEHSRIPLIIKGTPKQDAMRRDITINSLFYNLNTKEIEDQTEMGFNDLKRGIIRTPLCPETTLNDDPLRALRAIRFASKLNFKIDDNLLNVIKSNSIKELISKKVSKERILIEYTKMMSDSRFSLKYYSYLVDTGLIQVIFNNNSLHYTDSLKYFTNGIKKVKPSKQIESLEYFTTLILMNDYINGVIDIDGISKLLKEFKTSNKTSRITISHLSTIDSLCKIINTFINQQKNNHDIRQMDQLLDQFLINEYGTLTYTLLKSLREDDLWSTSIHLSRVYLLTSTNRSSWKHTFINNDSFWNTFSTLIQDKYHPISKSTSLVSFQDVVGAQLSRNKIGDIMKELVFWQWNRLSQDQQPTQTEAIIHLQTVFKE